jgi:hypothetical protein
METSCKHISSPRKGANTLYQEKGEFEVKKKENDNMQTVVCSDKGLEDRLISLFA